MAVANALGRRGFEVARPQPPWTPMMAWSTVCDDYLRVAEPHRRTQRWYGSRSFCSVSAAQMLRLNTTPMFPVQ